MERRFNVFLTLMVVVAVGYIICVVGDSLGVWETQRLQRELRAAELSLQKTEAEADLLQQRQLFWTSMLQGLASAKDSILVSITYMCGGFSNCVLIIIVVALLLARNGDGRKRERRKQERR